MTEAPAPTSTRIPWAFAIFLVLGGAIGWFSAFQLTIDKILVLQDADAILNCNISPIVQCGANLESPQGSVFGFPNPLLGLGGFVAPIAVGIAILAGARFARWFWVAFNIGLAGALAFVLWLITQSVYVLGTLCPWCMAVWTVTIPMFLAVTFRNLADGVYGDGPRRAGRALLPFVVPITVLALLLVGVLAQLRLDFISSLLRLL